MEPPESFVSVQGKDPEVKELIEFVESGTLPGDDTKACKIPSQESLLTVNNEILYFL